MFKFPLVCLTLILCIEIAATGAGNDVVTLGESQTGPAVGLPAGAEPGTIGLWFARQPGAANQVFFVYGHAEKGRARGLWLVKEDQLCFFFFGWPDDLHVKVPGGVEAGVWHHVAGTYDGTTARIYYDGKRLGQVETRLDTLPAKYFVGRNQHEDGRDFDGLLDEVKVHARALSNDEIQADYSRGIAARPKVDFPSLKDKCDVEEIVFAVRQVDTDGHWYANFGSDVLDSDRKYYHDGGRLCRLNIQTGEVVTLVEDSTGGVRDPQVHYDGEKILFSYRRGGQPHYHLYEINVDGTGLRQLTDGPYDDFEPTYVPDGGIIFCSSRCDRWVPCWYTQVAVLFRCDGDGDNIRQLSANTEQENTPWVLPDGRILYQRWEYVDRSQIGYHHLWTMNPDGTGQMVYFGNQHPDTVMIDAKPIPGTDQVVASFSPGHGRNEHMGVVTILDSDRGPDAKEMATPVSRGGFYRDPYPISEDLFLAAQECSIVLMDRQGHRETIYELPADWRIGRTKVHEPRPIRSRPRERVLPSLIDPSQPTGKVLLEDVHHGRNMEGVEAGDIKKLLVLEILPKPYNMFSGMEPLTYGGTFLLERVLGAVPVEADGSAYIELPAMRPLFFVALDENDMAVKRMQSFLTLQPDETLSCVGCHEQRTQTPGTKKGTSLIHTQHPADRSAKSEMSPFSPPLALGRLPSQIKPISNTPEVFDFPRDIQPILDRHCVECHDYEAGKRGGPMAGGIILSGDRGPMFSHSYYTLTISAQFADGRNLRKSNYPPRSLGSAASPLLRKLDGSHYEAKLTDHERTMLRLWIDTGAAYPGTYAALGTGMLGHYSHRGLDRPDLRWESTKAAQEVMTRRCNTCHTDKTALPTSPSDNKGMVPWGEKAMNDLALPESQRNNPVFRFNRHLIYNLSRPEKSLQLLAPLAKEAGGFGICQADGGELSAPFTAASDPDYQKLLLAIQDAREYLGEIKRFDMPGFQPRSEYVREMKRFGILPPDIDHDNPVDPYATDQAYWQAQWYRSPEEE